MLYSISLATKQVVSNYQNHKDFWKCVDLEISLTGIDDNCKKIIVGKKGDIIYEDKDKFGILQNDKSGRSLIVKEYMPQNYLQVKFLKPRN